VVSGSLPLMLACAFLGGLILNVMPCVLPVIALKVLSFVGQAKEKPGTVRKLGIVYGIGVLCSFLVLAAVAIGIQHAGGLASWSSAFQNPQFRMVLTILMTLVALNLFGVFEVTLGGRTMDVAGGLAAKNGVPGAFFNGVLAAVLATPCTAPFLATAIGFAFAQPSPTLVLIFLMVGAGLAAPFVILCWQPAWLAFLPKPGLWMQRFKVAMAFPMLATAVALLWVTGTHLGKWGVFWVGMFLVVMAFSAWIWGEFVQRGTKMRGLAMAISLIFVAGGYAFILENELHWRAPLGSEAEVIDWQPWSTEAVAKAREEGHPVLVDFTADTCFNCQVNLRRSIDVSATRQKLKDVDAVTLVADFTDANPAIAAELRKFGRAGVPLVLVYPADKNSVPLVLPDGLFSAREVQDALDKAAKPQSPPSSTAGL
jgi:thiol:disulfide interchange protein DsbD